MSDRIAIGIIRKPHGVRGEASIEPWTDSLDRFFDLERVTLVSPDEQSSREMAIDSVRLHSGRALVKFKEIDAPEELRAYQSWTVEIPEGDARKLSPGEYYLHQLVGLSVVDTGGNARGVVSDAYEGGSGILLTVKRDGGEFEMPFAAAICTEIDLEKRRIVAAIPEGLDDLEALPAIEDEIAPARSKGKKARAAEETPAGVPSPSEGETAAVARLRIDFVTIFPRMFDPLLAEGVIARGVRQGALDVRVWDLRDYATDRHRSTDDEAYGGGPGMVMLAEPVMRCVEAIRESAAPAGEDPPSPHLVLTSPQGRLFTQDLARELAGRAWVVILCGRYEGFDERILEMLQPDQISVGDFVVSGGELPAMLMADAAGRMIEGVVGNSGSVEEDSFFSGLLDYPHYTRPEEWRGTRVPDILMSGHHENIRRWRREQGLRATLARRPDLLESAELDAEARAILEKIREGR